MKVIVHPHALVHGLSKDEVSHAWNCIIKSRPRISSGEPMRWIAIGLLPDGRVAELVGVRKGLDCWVVFHALVPPTRKFLVELGM